MSIYEFTYVREQRVHLEIEAESVEDATEKAWSAANKLNLQTAQDQSDDPGALWLDDVRPEE